jgi:hypothetical protein
MIRIKEVYDQRQNNYTETLCFQNLLVYLSYKFEVNIDSELQK